MRGDDDYEYFNESKAAWCFHSLRSEGRAASLISGRSVYALRQLLKAGQVIRKKIKGEGHSPGTRIGTREKQVDVERGTFFFYF